MLISFYGTLAGVTANLLKGEAKLTIACKQEDMDDDVLDELAGSANTAIPSDVSLSYDGREVALPCIVAGAVTDHAKRVVKVTIAVAEKRIQAQDKTFLELWYRMEHELSVEVTNRQMTFDDIAPRASRRETLDDDTRVTVKIGGAEFDLDTVKAGLDVLNQSKAGFAGEEELINQAIEIVSQSQRASVSALQRQLRIGYTKAALLMDRLEERGIVGPMQNGEREILAIKIDPGTGEVLE